MTVATASLSESLIANVRREMDNRGWNQATLADKLGVPQPRISELFRGEYGGRLVTVEKLAKAFGIQPLSLLIPPPEE